MENLNKQEYQKYIKDKIPKPTYTKNMIFAFIVGGIICILGEFVNNSLRQLGFNEESVATGTSIALVFIGSLLTGLGIYDKIGTLGGAGASIPITGFANSIVAPAMEYKREGFIFGVAANMFIIAGPVLVYGVGGSILVGILRILLKR